MSFFPRPTRACLLALFFAVCLLALFAGMLEKTAFALPVAMRTYGVWSPGSKERFDVAVWYPGGSGDNEIRMDGWNIQASHNSRIIPGFYGVILLSHDTAGSRLASNDLAVALAANGFIVIAPSHMGDNQNSSDLIYTGQIIYNRPRELLQAMETVLNAPELSNNIDESRIGAVGVGFGAITAMQIAGANPSADTLAAVCAATQGTDPFCDSWSGGRMRQLKPALAALEKKYGETAFTPPLTLYSPTLEPAPPAPPPPPPPVKKESPSVPFFKRLFGKTEEPEVDASSASSQEDAEPTPSPFVFQGGKMFGNAASDGLFVIVSIPSASSTPSRQPSARTGIVPPEIAPMRTQIQRAQRRQASLRQLRGIALLAPAGGMLFSKQALASVRVPVTMVEAGQEDLYPLATHSQPYHNLAIQPETLRIAEADHFSLFAPCSPTLASILAENCGRATGKLRQQFAERRNSVIVSFFLSTLGGPQPAQPFSGFVATQSTTDTPQPQTLPPANSEKSGTTRRSATSRTHSR